MLNNYSSLDRLITSRSPSVRGSITDWKRSWHWQGWWPTVRDRTLRNTFTTFNSGCQWNYWGCIESVNSWDVRSRNKFTASSDLDTPTLIPAQSLLSLSTSIYYHTLHISDLTLNQSASITPWMIPPICISLCVSPLSHLLISIPFLSPPPSSPHPHFILY